MNPKTAAAVERAKKKAAAGNLVKVVPASSVDIALTLQGFTVHHYDSLARIVYLEGPKPSGKSER